MEDKIRVVGARTHNLKNVSVDIPKNKITVITGLSGSGKSSLAFDTIFAEGQRRYVESLSSFVRQFLSDIDKPDFDYIEGLAPAIAIDQKTAARNPRSTVATTTEIYDFLRLLFSRIGEPFCPKDGIKIEQQSTETIAKHILKDFTEGDNLKAKIYSSIIQNRKGEHKYHLKQAKKTGVLKVRFDSVEMDIEEAIALEIDKNKKHSLELLVGKVDFPVSNEQSKAVIFVDLLKLAEKGLKMGNGMLIVMSLDDTKERFYSQKYACTKCGWQFPDIEPRLFSFNNPEGACQACQGLGVRLVADPELVIPNQRLTIAEGAIRPWSRTTSQTSWYQKALQDLAKKYEFSLDTPVEKLPKEVVEIVLNGEPGEEEGRFEGVIPNLERRYLETDSEYLRNEIEKYMLEKLCQVCLGQRLRTEVLNIKIKGRNIIDVTSDTIEQSSKFFGELLNDLNEKDSIIAKPIAKEVKSRLDYLLEVGLGYLTLNRTSSTLAGGEAQRIRLANQLGSGLTGVVYILDEPSIGLHARDHEKLLKTITELKHRGNTVIIVEHDKETMLRADYIIDMGPGAGEQGGEVIAIGTPDEIKKDPNSLTGAYLSDAKRIELPEHRHEHTEEFLTISGATGNNLKNVTATFPLNQLICVTGVSGSGKSTLVEDTLAVALTKHFNNSSTLESAPYKEIKGLEHLDNIININQSAIGRTPRSNPATYTSALGPIRELFANTNEAMEAGFDASRFSFNLRGGRCENCRGDGQIKIEMNFLPDIYVPCQECKGRRYNADTLEIKYKGKDISDVLAMTVDEALDYFDTEEEVREKLLILQAVGLGYIHLGQPATTLSGGEAQRIKLAAELAKRETGKTLYILDEPTTGLHFEDIQRLLKVLYKLVDRGNTVIIIEHNIDVIRCADWVIDMGPDGGDKGGMIVAEGTPEDVAKVKESVTGQFLCEDCGEKIKREKAKARA